MSAPRAIQSVEELILLIRIYESQGRYEEIVTLLDSDAVGIGSRLVQNDWNLVHTKLDCLGKGGMWTEGLRFAKSLLKVPDDPAAQKAAQELDDWAAWNLLVVATENIDTAE